MDVLAATPSAIALNSCSAPGVNQVRMVFLDPEARNVFPDWPRIAAETVAGLRVGAGTDLDDPRLTELVGELSLKSEDFRRLWAKHDVRAKTAGEKRFVHPLVGELGLSYETFTVNGAPGQTLVVYHAEPDSDSAQSLALLAGIPVKDAPMSSPAR